MAKVDDRLQRRAKQVVLAVVARLAHRSPNSESRRHKESRTAQIGNPKTQENRDQHGLLAKSNTYSDQIAAINQWLLNTSRATDYSGELGMLFHGLRTYSPPLIRRADGRRALGQNISAR
jgi:hypothetical protein